MNLYDMQANIDRVKKAKMAGIQERLDIDLERAKNDRILKESIAAGQAEKHGVMYTRISADVKRRRKC